MTCGSVFLVVLKTECDKHLFLFGESVELFERTSNIILSGAAVILDPNKNASCCIIVILTIIELAFAIDYFITSLKHIVKI